MSNENLRKARQVKNDEFYTLYEDIEIELSYYKPYFKNKIVYCNCDTPESNFVKFFNDVKFDWGIKDVWHTSLAEGISYDSDYAKELLNKCDIVVTNPPFSKSRAEFVPLLMSSGKKFLFIGNLNLATMKEIFPLIKDLKMYTGYTHPKSFIQPDGSYKKFGNIVWYTNLPVHKELKLNPANTYYGNENKYPKYDNYDAINVDRLSEIPVDYHGVMGVPITFIEKWCPDISEWGGFGSSDLEMELKIKSTESTGMQDTSYKFNCYGEMNHGSDNELDFCKPVVHGMVKFPRIIIGITEENGRGNSGGVFTDNTVSYHALISGKKKYTRLFIKGE